MFKYFYRFLFSKGYNQSGKNVCRLIGKINKKKFKKINWKNAVEDSLVVQVRIHYL